MSTIKYRVWDTENKVFVDEDAIFLHQSGTLLLDCGAGRLLGRMYIISGQPERYIIQQFTGLTDKSGKDIYEGDIIAYLDNTSQGLIKKIVMITDIRHLPDFTCSKWQEIIGNIYENSELLKEEQP